MSDSSEARRPDYDTRHQPRFFDTGDLAKLRLHRGYRAPGIRSHKIGAQFAPFCVGPANDSNLLRMPKVVYNTGGDINRQKATWHKVVHEAPNTIINSPQDIEQDCWFSANMKSSGKLDRGSEPFKSYKLGQRQGGGQNKWTIQTVILVLKNPWMQAMGRHHRDENDGLAFRTAPDAAANPAPDTAGTAAVTYASSDIRGLWAES